MKDSISNFHWIPRIICILDIIFISIFAFDAFSPNDIVLMQLAHFFVNLTPTFLLIIFLIIAWRRELVGGIIFTLAAIAVSPMIYQHNYGINHSVSMSIGIIMMITFPIFVVGILFIASHFREKRHRQESYNR
ncbi:hypothetical protein [uncultured Acetobacteroides sp.]|uniref:DUF7670 domain-containing protein n=1 Tax=uncultured Acetobacteroides sp. TaxID=1760811 RepID=UPI0029F4DC76|nr:hypothetical protein [uncultured Acetobacteroides sp.]